MEMSLDHFNAYYLSNYFGNFEIPKWKSIDEVIFIGTAKTIFKEITKKSTTIISKGITKMICRRNFRRNFWSN